jgi:hypothetical protein
LKNKSLRKDIKTSFKAAELFFSVIFSLFRNVFITSNIGSAVLFLVYGLYLNFGCISTRLLSQGDQMIPNKFAQSFKSSQNSRQAEKGQNIYIIAPFKSPKHLHQTTFKT